MDVLLQYLEIKLSLFIPKCLKKMSSRSWNEPLVLKKTHKKQNLYEVKFTQRLTSSQFLEAKLR